MDRLESRKRKRDMKIVVHWWSQMMHLAAIVIQLVIGIVEANSRNPPSICSDPSKFQKRSDYLRRLVYENPIDCHAQLRVDTRTFVKLCAMLETRGGLRPTKNMNVDELVAMFLYILAHHLKNRVVKFHFMRSGETVHRHFRSVLNALLMCQDVLLAKPQPIPNDCTDPKWKWFKGALGALDGTYIEYRVPHADKPRYRSRKGVISSNVLAVCNPMMEFIYVLPGWEGSAQDSRVLADAITRRHGLKVPRGNYYLCDAGYTNCEGFLAPYRGQRYHLEDWRRSNRLPTTPKEAFNYKHASGRNVIERGFAAIKVRWGIIRSPSFYPVKIQTRIITACCLLHNLIKKEMPIDPLEHEIDVAMESIVHDNENENEDFVTSIDPSTAWSEYRDQLSNEIFVGLGRNTNVNV